MKTIAVIYWSGTGNTEAMAEYVAEGAAEVGAKADVLTPAEFSAGILPNYDALVFGCPSMGAEQLEESEFEPMFNALLPELRGRKIALFGSYGWGSGEWMEQWQAQCENAGCKLICACVTCHEAPDKDAADACRALGRACCAQEA